MTTQYLVTGFGNDSVNNEGGLIPTGVCEYAVVEADDEQGAIASFFEDAFPDLEESDFTFISVTASDNTRLFTQDDPADLAVLDFFISLLGELVSQEKTVKNFPLED